MRILIINHVYLEYDLSATTQLSITKSLNKLGHKTTLYVPSLIKKVDQNIKRLHLPSKNTFLSSPILNIKLFFLYPLLLNNEKPDVIIVDHLTYPSAILYIVASKIHLIKTSFVFDVRSQPVSLVGLSGKLRYLEYIWALKTAKYMVDNFTFLTLLMAEDQCKLAGIKAGSKSIGIWGCGVDIDVFNPRKYYKSSEKLKISLGLQNKFIVFYHGVLAPNRGLENVIHAMSNVKETNRDIVFFMLGDGTVKTALQKIIIKQGLEDSVIIHAPVPHEKVPDYIALANVCIIPLPNHDNWRAQQPIKLSEYLAMNKVVVVTKIPAHTSVLENSKAGIIVEANDPGLITDAIIKAYKNRRNLCTLGSAGRSLILRNFTWDIIARQLLQYLQRVKEA